ncbi:aminoacetone oxidase family FAD-binding enzyme [Slackia piriformis]|uniref:aminoacetone oxidase family FAD-binding enzyme n=1 Tax=Slackia piriformis TaxID=626934 RepID=UPI0032BF860B
MARVAVVGGGASGLVAAIEAARSGADVVLYEEADRVGKKILATGNGRCNLSNADIMSDDYNRPEFVQEAMNELPPEDVLQMFVSAGLLVSEEDEGRIYPYSNKAATVVDVLRLCFTEAGAKACCSSKVERIVPAGEAGEVQNAALCENDGGRWVLVCADGAVEAFDSVIVAVGGAPEKGLVPDDVKYVSTHPVLVGLKTDTANIKGLSGIRVRARLYLDTDPEDLRDAWMDVVDPDFEADYVGPEERGEILFRDYGISGIAAFDMSRYVRPGQMVFIDLLPDLDPQEKVDFIWNQVLSHPSRTACEVLSGMMPSRVARAVVTAAGLNPDEPIIAEQEAVVLAMVSESFGLTVKGIADPKQAQVMRGGYAVKHFCPSTMECKKHAGLYAVGEALDIDGRCGGYNLHWAWTSGILAGRAAAGAVRSVLR